LAAAAALLAAAYLLRGAGWAIRYDSELTWRVDGGEVTHAALAALGSLLAAAGFLWGALRFRGAGSGAPALRGPLWLATAGFALAVVGSVAVFLGVGNLSSIGGLSIAAGAFADLGVAVGTGLLAAAVAYAAGERRRRLLEAAGALAAGFAFATVASVLNAIANAEVPAAVSGGLIPGLYVASAGALGVTLAAATAAFAYSDQRPQRVGALAVPGGAQLLTVALTLAAVALALVGLGEAMAASTLAGLHYEDQIVVASWVTVGARLVESLAFVAAVRAVPVDQSTS
jgi:hypothetical protein